jgi:multiple sugar transport system substrate-binding protein
MKRSLRGWWASAAISALCLGVLLPVDMSLAGTPVTLKVMRPGYPKEARAFFTEVQKGLAKEYPDIKLEIVDSDWNTFHSRAPIWVAGKQEPDVYLCSQTDLAAIVDIGAVLPLDGLVDPKLRADVPAGAWQSVKYKGRTVAIPGDYAPFVLWYNKDVFKKAGLDPQKPPTTWDELLQYALKIKQNTDVAPIGAGVGRALDFTQLVWGMLFYSATNEQYVDDTGKPQITSEESLRAHQFLVDLVRKHKVTLPDPQLYSKGDLRLLFRDEKVAMVVDGPWLMNVLDKKYDLSTPDKSKFGIAPAPRSPVQGKVPMYASTTDAWVVSANSKYPEEAKKLLLFLVRPEWQYSHDHFVQQMPFRKSLFNESAKYPLAGNWIYRGMGDVMDNTISFQPIIPTANAVFDTMKNGVVKMVTGAAPVAQAAKEAADAIKAAHGIK